MPHCRRQRKRPVPSVELVLEGNVPSKKNSRVHTRSGASIPSKAFTDWQDDAITQLKFQTKERFFNPVRVDVVIYYGNLREADTDNRYTSILDMLVKALILKSDKWLLLPRGSFDSIYRKGKPGATIKITETEPAFTQL